MDERRQRRAALDARMSPMGVTARPEAPEPPPPGENALGKAIESAAGMYANHLMNNADTERDSGNVQLSTPPQPDRTMLDRTSSPISMEQRRQPAAPRPARPATRMPQPAYDPTVQAPSPAGSMIEARGMLPSAASSDPNLQKVMPRLTGGVSQGVPSPEMDTRSGYGVPIPSIPGTGGGPRPYDPIEKARYESAMSGAKTAKPIDPNNPETFYQPQREKRGFWNTLKSAGVGALQGLASGQGLGGALGGALAGGVIGGINPMVGRAMQFDAFERPRMEQDMIRQTQLDQLQRQRQMEQLGMNKTAAEIGRIEAETQALPGRETQRQRLTESQIEANKARAAAANRPPARRLQRVRTPDEKGRPVDKFVPEEEGASYPVYERPRLGRGGAGGGRGDSERPSNEGLTLYNNVLKAKRDAEEAWSLGDTGAARAAQAYYNQLADELGRRFPGLYEVGAQELSPEQSKSGELGWRYIKSR